VQENPDLENQEEKIKSSKQTKEKEFFSFGNNQPKTEITNQQEHFTNSEEGAKTLQKTSIQYIHGSIVEPLVTNPNDIRVSDIHHSLRRENLN
jgi:hypothetical protein